MRAGFYKNKRVLVTGHRGFVGSWLCKVLDMAGAEVFGYGFEPDTTPSLFYTCRLDKKVKSYTGDVRDYEELNETFDKTRPEIVIHLASQPLVLEGFERPGYTFDTNVMGTVNLLDCVRNTSCVKSVVNVTSDKVYLNRDWDWSYRENEELKGEDPYSSSKSCSELITYSYGKSFFADRDIGISTLRPSNLIGGGDFARDRLIPDCVRAAMDKEDIVIRSPYASRCYQHVLEAVMAILMLAKAQYNDKSLAGCYNVGPDDSGCWTNGNLAGLFCEAWKRYTGREVKWVCANSEGPKEASRMKVDSTKIRKVLGWEPRWNIERAMDRTVEWHVEYKEEKDIPALMEKQIREFLR